MGTATTRPLQLGSADISLELLADGSSIMRSTQALLGFPGKITDG